jgi:hypothetical protein
MKPTGYTSMVEQGAPETRKFYSSRTQFLQPKNMFFNLFQNINLFSPPNGRLPTVIPIKIVYVFLFPYPAAFLARYSLSDRIILRALGEKNATRKQRKQVASEQHSSSLHDTKQVGCPVKLRTNSKFQNLPSHS